MKGRKLSLQEVLNLEDGSKVWVEELDDGYKGASDLYKKIKERLYILNTDMYYDLKCDFVTPIEFYEWVEDNSNPMMLFDEDYDSNIINKISVEICNLLGLDLTDDNIRLIVEEFKEVK